MKGYNLLLAHVLVIKNVFIKMRIFYVIQAVMTKYNKHQELII